MIPVQTIVKDLIALPSINPMGREDVPAELAGESRVAQYVEDFVRRAGVDVIAQETGVPGRRNVGGMLYRGADRPTIILQSHSDTVGVAGELSLLTPVERDGRIYGRGACDDKGPLAAMLSALDSAARNGARGTYNIIVMAVADEEHLGKGCTVMDALPPTAGAWFGIVGEPTLSRIVNGYKGVARWEIETRGVVSHSSQPEKGVNAIYRMGRILCVLEEYSRVLAGIADDRLGCETVSVGTIHGGSAVNIVPDRCVISIDRRVTRRMTSSEVQEHMGRYLTGGGIDFAFEHSPLHDAYEAALIGHHPMVHWLSELSRRLGLDPDPRVVSFGSDAYRMNASGIPTVLWGPGTIDVAHGPLECISVDDLLRASEWYLGVMAKE